MQLPAGLLNKMNLCLSFYRVLSEWKKANSEHRSVEWSKKNPRDWEMVSGVLADRLKGNK